MWEECDEVKLAAGEVFTLFGVIEAEVSRRRREKL